MKKRQKNWNKDEWIFSYFADSFVDTFCLFHFVFSGVYDTDNLYKCNYENWTNLHNDFDYDTNCFEHCPRECDSIKYEYEPQDLGGVAAVGDHVIPLSNSSFSICIYFQDLKYTEISQKPKTTWSDLISKIGGTLGLFIGVRLLSLMEIFQFVIEIGKMFAKTYVRNWLFLKFLDFSIINLYFF